MRQFVIDDLSQEEHEKVAAFLDHNTSPGPIAGMFWLQLPESQWGPAQEGHHQCAPFFFAIELTDQRVVFELLIRTQATLHCTCIAHATKTQRQLLLDFIDRLIDETAIRS